MKIGIVGFGGLGRGHFANLQKMKELDFEVVALCDKDPEKFNLEKTVGLNIDLEQGGDIHQIEKYTDMDEMIENVDMDLLISALPSDLHAEAAIKALNKGIHVFSEKPMALSSDDCNRMIQAAEKNKKKLAIGHCLRFFPAYIYLKKCVDEKIFGNVMSAKFQRFIATPLWSAENWLLQDKRSGSVIFDLHVHDVDVIHWIFGMPDAVTTDAVKILPETAFDAVHTKYTYRNSDALIFADADWSYHQGYPFTAAYTVRFEKATVVFQDQEHKLLVCPDSGTPFEPDITSQDGYCAEIKNMILNLMGKEGEILDPYSIMNTIKIVEAEKKSALSQKTVFLNEG